jgi:rsbT co-antagonist protein RsbR
MPATVYTPDDLLLFDLLETLIWVVDLETGVQRWANQACLPVWGASSRADLLARSAASRPPSEASRTRLQALRRRYERGERSLDRWTLYPDRAPPFRVECKSSGIMIAARAGAPASLAMLVEGRLLDEHEDVEDRRGVEALRYLGELVSLYTPDGAVLMRNPAAVRVLGEALDGDAFATGFGEPHHAARARAEIAAGRVYRADCRLGAPHGRWFATEARGSLDPVTGEEAILVTQRDISELRERIDEIAEQAATLRGLSAPVLAVDDGILAVPLIGAIDRARIDAVLSALHEQIATEPVTAVIVDLTGAGELDAPAAEQLRRIARVLRLQGVTLVYSGLRPEHARSLATMDGMGKVGGLEQPPCFARVAVALRQLPIERRAHARGRRSSFVG